jgi:hypothetical protein
MTPIITRYIYPPIPQRFFDWCAYRDPEPGFLCGWGSTEQLAIADLLELEEELEEAHADYAQWCKDEQRRSDAREGFDD